MKKVEGRKLAEGEITGHAHVLSNSEVFEREDGLRTFDGSVENALTHEEHKLIHLPKICKKYISGKVLEYDHFAEEVEEVKD